MKLGFVFLCIAAVMLHQALRLENILLKLILLSASVSFLGVGFAYAFRAPKLFLKTRRGSMSLFSLALFWPYRLLNFLSLLAFRLVSSKPAYHEISPGLFLGCRLFSSDKMRMENHDIQSVLDLTCEFEEVEFLRGKPAYLCIPLLDTTAPTISDLEAGISFIQSHLREGSVYVHCALGHGRSATFVVGYLLIGGIAPNLGDALELVRSKRSGVRLHPEQLAVLKQLKYGDEIFDIVNERDEVIGKKLRREVHRDGDKHRAVHVLVFNSRGEVFLQKRSMSKDTFPGAWDSSASGHLDCGEDYDACAIRELREEIGLRLENCPKRLFKIAACLETGQEFVWVYRCENEGPFTLHPEEIERGEWFAPEFVTKWIAEKPEEFASAFVLIWKKLAMDTD